MVNLIYVRARVGLCQIHINNEGKNKKKNAATTTIAPFFECISLLGKLNGFLCFF